jgi:thiol:disulfide interchange protein/DsbC/DsbD-like thiol-disulfide interchange protein
MLRYAVAATIWVLAMLAAATPAAWAQAPPKVHAELIAAVEKIVPGVPFTVGLNQRITPHWHTYWKNPGDSGEPTRITWSLPDGFTASEIAWPIPAAIPVGPLMNYGYSDALLLPVTITPPEHLDATSVHLKARAQWLVCEKICIPEAADLELTLRVDGKGAPPAPSEHAPLFAQTAQRLPASPDWATSFVRAPAGLALKVATSGLDPKLIKDAFFFPDTWGAVEHAAPQTLTSTDDGLLLELKPGEMAGQLKTLSGVLVVTERHDGTDVRQGFALHGDVHTAAAAAAPPAPTPASDTTGITLWQAMAFALLGGLILNLMPCVLPILSLKAIALAGHGGNSRNEAGNEAARSGLAYLAGILVSFALLAVLLAALRSAGLALGWGFQFQSPIFVLAMAALFLTLALSLSGVFDIGGSVVGLGESLTRKSGQSGSFFTGVLATIAATPCTAPFMGAAVGYALTRPPFEMALVLQAMGIGFALPVLALSISRSARALLPKPGPWMETFKQVLAFPLYATVAWLVWVLSLQTGSDGVLGAGIVLIATAFAAWLLGSGKSALWLRGAIAAVIAVAAFAMTAPQLKVIAMADAPQAGAAHDIAAAEPYSEARVAELRAAGRPVFVNLTAAWCISCKVNELVALRSDGFRKALTDHNAAYLKGDWTNQDDRITRLLRAHGRAGVPLYLLYPADPQRSAIVLPQLLTEAIVVSHFASLSRPQAAAR